MVRKVRRARKKLQVVFLEAYEAYESYFSFLFTLQFRECLSVSKNCAWHRYRKKVPNGWKKLHQTFLPTKRPKGHIAGFQWHLVFWLREKSESVILFQDQLAQSKWSLFDMVGLFSSGVKMTLKVGLVPMETTPTISWWQFFLNMIRFHTTWYLQI